MLPSFYQDKLLQLYSYILYNFNMTSMPRPLNSCTNHEFVYNLIVEDIEDTSTYGIFNVINFYLTLLFFTYILIRVFLSFIY
ncbi:unnamed protein product [Meloidogyne enterolobii]|uniref:Uncharacterized protein n=1 Tax=Meloidogyne enterolobii TaxID=390850 RepID=A0ACB0YVW8_MELEN